LVAGFPDIYRFGDTTYFYIEFTLNAALAPYTCASVGNLNDATVAPDAGEDVQGIGAALLATPVPGSPNAVVIQVTGTAVTVCNVGFQSVPAATVITANAAWVTL
jgi:hypothetical protein